MYLKKLKDRISHIVEKVSEDAVGLRGIFPYIVVIAYVMLSAAILMTCTTSGDFSPDPRTEELQENCLKMHSDYGTYILYVIQLCTTIGYGDMRPCTTAGKVATLLVSIAGLPLVVYIIMDAGDRMEKWCRDIHCRYKRHVKRRNHKKFRNQSRAFGENLTLSYADQNVVEETNNVVFKNVHSSNVVNPGYLDINILDTDRLENQNHLAVSESDISQEHLPQEVEPCNDDDMCDLPLWIGPLVLLLCVSMCSIYYYFAEGYGFGFAIYYSMLTFLTGSFHSFTFPDVLPIYFIIFVGFSMLSMTINAILGNIKNATTKIKTEVKRQIDNASLDENGKLDIPPVDELVEATIKKYGSSTLVVFLPKSGLEELKTFCTNSAESAQDFLQMKQSLETQLADAISGLKTFNTSKTSTSDLLQAVDASSQTFSAENFSTECQCTASIAHNSTQAETRTSNAGILVRPEVTQGYSQTAAELSSQPEVSDKAVTASPRVRHIGMQHPRASQLARRASEAIGRH